MAPLHPLRHQGADCRGLRALGRLAAQNSLPGLRFTCGTLCLTPAIRFTDLGALPAASGLSVPETALRAGIHLLGLALTRSPPRYAWLSPRSRQNADARPQFGPGSGALPPSEPRPPVAFGSSLRPQFRRLPHQVASWTWGTLSPHKNESRPPVAFGSDLRPPLIFAAPPFRLHLLHKYSRHMP